MKFIHNFCRVRESNLRYAAQRLIAQTLLEIYRLMIRDEDAYVNAHPALNGHKAAIQPYIHTIIIMMSNFLPDVGFSHQANRNIKPISISLKLISIGVSVYFHIKMFLFPSGRIFVKH